MYTVCVVTQGRKARLNLTIDPDIHRDARRVFSALDMNMSGFIEGQLVTFLQMFRPFESLLDQVEAGTVDPAALKVAMRSFNAVATGFVGEQLVQFSKIAQDIENSIEEGNTDKK
jgi:hypothetical protein